MLGQLAGRRALSFPSNGLAAQSSVPVAAIVTPALELSSPILSDREIFGAPC